eukprot:564709-Prymnesium_polylepis.1
MRQHAYSCEGGGAGPFLLGGGGEGSGTLHVSFVEVDGDACADLLAAGAPCDVHMTGAVRAPELSPPLAAQARQPHSSVALHPSGPPSGVPSIRRALHPACPPSHLWSCARALHPSQEGVPR